MYFHKNIPSLQLDTLSLSQQIRKNNINNVIFLKQQID